ncbi:type I DNA topoisomerase [bacterium]|nr:MAG: type I DNA topoisomerase [bacterium]QQR61930.1 MAG: type I DNA topoisomerase [bacterium]
MKKLIIVESPAKIKTIAKFLSSDYKILSTMGHIKDLPTKEIGISLTDAHIELSYVILEGKDKMVNEITKAARAAQEIYLAPDPDREGEIIAWHIDQEIEKVIKKECKVYRISFNEITKQAILSAIDNPSTIDQNKVAAQQARRALDRWVGYEVSPILWKKLAPGLSAGRVQSVALRIICDREEAIRAFKAEEYWSIEGQFGYEKEIITANLSHIGKDAIDIKTTEQADEIVKKIKKTTFSIETVTDKNREKNAAAPFMTSSLQQAAYNRLGFSVKKTMQVAQKLYEGIPLQDPTTPVALITYMRTDSLRLAETAIKQIRPFIEKNFGKEYLPKTTLVYEKKGKKGTTQDAHEAVRPIDIFVTPETVYKYADSDSAKLYELIWQRTVACQMQAALYAQRTITIKGDQFIFKATGSTLLFDGYLKVYGIDEEDEDQKQSVLPDVKPNTAVSTKKISPKQHFTQAPARYSEASLVKELEKAGIGRPSTYATILNTIRARSYTTLEKKRFLPTELGMAVTRMLTENLPDIMDLKFTARMEEDLDKIAQGTLERDKLLRGFYKRFSKELSAFLNKHSKKAGKIIQMTELDCPTCKKNKLAILYGKTGEFIGCSGYPDCSFTSNFKREENGDITLIATEAPQLLDETCPQCGKQLRVLKGKFGPFTGCSGYPDCKYIKQTKAPFACPLCKKDIVQRAWKGGKFWGCSGYPKCKLAIFDQWIEEPCPQCHWPFLLNKNGKISCANKECGYKK